MRIALLGDLALVGRYDLRSHPQAYERLNALAAHLANFDVVVGNLESPLTARRRSHIPKSMHLWANPESAQLLNHLHVGAVSLANNHINDFGRTGLDATLSALQSVGIPWFGIDGGTLTFERDGERIVLSGFACLSTNGTGYAGPGGRGVNLLTRGALERQLQQDREAGAFSVLSLHWGQEHTHLPNPEHLRLARSLAESERFLLHGHHPHVLQGAEAVNESLLAYSLGNCLFDDCVSLDGQKRLRQLPQNERSIVLEVELERGRIAGWNATGFVETAEGIVISDQPANEVAAYSRFLDLDPDSEDYTERRNEEIASTLAAKFGNRDIRWLASRMNYHSIGSRLAAIPRRARYRRIKREF